ncbi:uncharacterized protein LOC127566167 [Drosophila albomicans]|uniref:Uncharacterized protein LOC127566167 n=1 Tax=Drosophila albomicans TaxID=7291 RepID=A0A9C6T9F0_DROAB|nr:uncharacterized protein LOC127566167 [Drosophila albomicans]XP_051863883.1 uncharacterized protein LOC127566167 [Drosophila albomicans]
MDSSDDDDSAKSIPRPIYEATSAIDSPPPHLLLSSAGHDMEQQAAPLKRSKYVVSSPPGSANGGSNSSSSNAWPAATTTAAVVGHASLTMKITKVSTTPQPQQQQMSELKPANTSTPKDRRVPKEMIALQRSHNESKVLTGYVSDGLKLKRRKSRAVAAQLIKQSVGGLSNTLPAEAESPERAGRMKMALKRSKSIPAPMCDSDTEWQEDSELKKVGKKKTLKKKRNYSVAYDDMGYCVLGRDQLSVSEESNSNPARRSFVDGIRERFRSRSKTVSRSSEEHQPRRGNLRSENEEFARKHNAFLDRVINDTLDGPATQLAEADSVERRTSSTADTDANISMYSDISEAKTQNASEEIEQRLDERWQPPPRVGWDPFCWKCRDCGKLMPCSKCLRSYHSFCVRPASTKFDDTWKCPECVLIESAPKRSRRSDVSGDLLSQLLSFALERMKLVRGVHKLRAPQEVLPENYKKFFANPVSFESLSERIKSRAFNSSDEFLSEVKWIQHNTLILDTGDVKAEQASKAVVKICRQEANEIDTCAECYLNANSSDEWFVKVCTHPHLLLWAKLKGFPYWPAKAMGNGPNAVVNVRFFGKHDRANVPVKDCFLYCAQDPNTQTSRRSARDLAECIREVEVHIEHIKSKIGSFNYAPYRKPYDPLEEQQQLEEMMPGVTDDLNKHLEPANKTPLQFLIRKTAGDKLSIVKKTKATESGNESDPSGSPIKKSTQETESPPPPPSQVATSESPKPKSSNYEVIPRVGDALRESRGCTVVLKRKSLGTCKTSAKLMCLPSSDIIATSSIKRKHSQSDASSETSQQGLTMEHKRRTKHARKQVQEDSAAVEPEELAKQPKDEKESDTESQKPDVEQAAAEQTQNEASPAVVSVVELVRRRQGVTITKIPREQQQAATIATAAETSPVATATTLLTAPPPSAGVTASPATAATSTSSPRVATSKPVEPTLDETVAKQRAVERQQQQLISKVVPFVEIKKEVLSEAEDSEETTPATEPLSATEELQQAMQQRALQLEQQQQALQLEQQQQALKLQQQQQALQLQQQQQQALQLQQQQQQALQLVQQQQPEPATSTVPEANAEPVATEPTERAKSASSTAAAPTEAASEVPAGIKIKEEVLSEDEMETEQGAYSRNAPTMPPPPLPNRAEAASTVSNAAGDSFVCFVGDTTIQRLSQKQSPKSSESSKRNALRGVPHGPLPASAMSPSQTPPSASPSPSPSSSPSPKQANNSQRPTPQASPKTQSQKSPVAQQLRVKSDKCLGSTTSPPPPPPQSATTSLLKSNMVVIPMEPRSSNGGNSNCLSSSAGSSSNLSNSNLMTIPVPPLRAVSKNTLQTTAAMPTVPLPPPAPAPPPAYANNALLPPPLAGLTTSTPTTAPAATIRTAANAEPGGLLASALNGLPSDTLVSESPVCEPITPGVATAFSELVLRSGPPKLTARPTGPLQSDGSNIYPSQSGPLSTRLKENAHKITDYFISVIEDTLSDLAGGEPSVLQARIAGLTLENERIKQHYERQLADMQRSTDLMISEMRKTIEQENKRVLSELRQQSTLERMRAVEDAKKKQWCANCMREAQLYCCWNTSYCDYPCQQMHWQRHSASCGQAATLQAQSTAQQQQQQQQQSQVPPSMHAETPRGKQKTVANNATSPGQQMNRTQGINVAPSGSKKWSTHQSMISLVNPPPPSTEVLKLPNNTFLRPVSLPTTVPSPSNNNIVSPVTLITPSNSSQIGNNLMPGQRNNLNYASKQTQPIPVQRYNIPLPITVSNAGSFGLISEQHHKQVPKPTGRNSTKNNNRMRNIQPNSQLSNNSNNNNAQTMRHNQINHVFPQ